MSLVTAGAIVLVHDDPADGINEIVAALRQPHGEG